jgi:hypothetical protein
MVRSHTATLNRWVSQQRLHGIDIGRLDKVLVLAKHELDDAVGLCAITYLGHQCRWQLDLGQAIQNTDNVIGLCSKQQELMVSNQSSIARWRVPNHILATQQRRRQTVSVASAHTRASARVYSACG